MKSAWRPISTAPMDGTMVLITETPNGEHYNVMPASYMNQGGHSIGWWAVDVTRWSSEEGPLPWRFKPIACRPLCWQPLPERESLATLHRREGQIYSDKRAERAQLADAAKGVQGA